MEINDKPDIGSLFLLTINTNKNFNDYYLRTQFVNALHNATERFFKYKLENFRYESFQPRNGRFYNIPPYLKWNVGSGSVKQIRVRFTIEQGELRRRIHVHALVDVVHNGNIHIDTDYIKYNFALFLNKEGVHLGGTSDTVYVNVKYIRTTNKQQVEENVLRYMTKSNTLDVEKATDLQKFVSSSVVDIKSISKTK